MDLTKVRLWMEMHPKVVLPALIKVQDGEWTFTVLVTVPVNEERKRFKMTELTRCREEPRQLGDGAPVKSRQLGQVRGSMGDKVDNSWSLEASFRFKKFKFQRVIGWARKQKFGQGKEERGPIFNMTQL